MWVGWSGGSVHLMLVQNVCYLWVPHDSYYRGSLVKTSGISQLLDQRIYLTRIFQYHKLQNYFVL